MTKNNKIKIIKSIGYIVILASVILLISDILKLNFDNLKANHYGGIIGNILIIIGMIFWVRILNKQINK